MGQEYFWVPLRFCEKYAEAIAERKPLFLGYLFHLWLDVSFMTNFVSKIPMSEMINRRHEVREWKWKDAGLFIKGHQFRLSIDNLDDIIAQAKLIEEVKISRKDLLLAADYVEKAISEYEGEDYSMYKANELAEFYEKICCDFIAWVKEK